MRWFRVNNVISVGINDQHEIFNSTKCLNIRFKPITWYLDFLSNNIAYVYVSATSRVLSRVSISHLQLVTCGEQGVMFSVICFKTTRWHWGTLAMLQRRSSTTKSRLRAPTAPTYSSITCLLTLTTANLQRPFALSVLSFRPKYSSTKRQICLNVLVSSAETVGW